jgi:hypothetical protein
MSLTARFKVSWEGCISHRQFGGEFNRYIQSTCATSGEGLYEGLDWLSSNIANKVSSKPGFASYCILCITMQYVTLNLSINFVLEVEIISGFDT